jgi:hypothetical protein
MKTIEVSLQALWNIKWIFIHIMEVSEKEIKMGTSYLSNN